MVYFITQQSSFVVPALRSLVPGVFMSDSLLADEGSAGLRSHGTHGRLSDKGTENSGQDSCAGLTFPCALLVQLEQTLPKCGARFCAVGGNLVSSDTQLKLSSIKPSAKRPQVYLRKISYESSDTAA